MRSEFVAVAAGFALLPQLTGANGCAVVVNGSGTALVTTTGALVLAGNFTTTGAFATTLAQQANVTLTLPASSDTLVGRATTDTLTNKTLTSPVINGSITGAYTLAGTPTIAGAAISGATLSGTTTLSGPLAATGQTITAGTFSGATLSGTTTLSGPLTASGQTVTGGTFNGVALTNASTVNGNTFTTGTGTLSIAAGKTLTASNSITLAGTDGKTLTVSNSMTLAGADATVMTFPGTSATIARIDAANTFVGTQTFGALVYTTLNGNTWATGTGTLSIAAGKTLTASNSLTLAGTDGQTMTFPTTSATIARTDAANTFTGVQTMTSPAITTPAFTGAFSGTYTLGGTPTIGAVTLSGTVSGGGNQLNNVVIGSTTPLAGTFTTLLATGFPLRSFIAGLTLSNDSGTPTTVLDISAGQCTDSTNAANIILGAFTKSTGGSWTAGSGNNGMGGGLTIANTTWYHVFAIINAGAADVYFDTSVTAANKPAGTTAFRRIGSFLTDGSAHILGFIQDEETFWWVTQTQDVSTTVANGAGGSLFTLNVPPGVKVKPVIRALSPAANTGTIIFTSPDESDVAPGAGVANLPGFDLPIGPMVWAGVIYTNTAQQIRARASTASQNVDIYTRGWIDSRGRFN